jgi:phage shock protein PspC (stress-responsive transcriptional regulator)
MQQELIMSVQSSLWNRPDTLLGVCEGIGQDFGFNPIFLRIALAASILWDPKIAIGTYFALGLLVAASRLLFPNKATVLSQSAANVADEPAVAIKQDIEERELAEAA